jgi:hypothetical protein
MIMRIVRIAALVLVCHFVWAASAAAEQIRIALVNREVVVARLNRVVTKPRERFSVLRAIFEEAGCPPERIEEQRVRGTSLPNLICSLPGSTAATVVVGAHYDFDTDYGRGVVDNWTGASLLPSLYEALQAGGPHPLNYIFVGFTGEEKGLIGSKHYIKALSVNAKSNIRGMVNLDCLGLDSTKVEFQPKSEQLAIGLLGVARQLKLPLDAIDLRRIGSSDHESFDRAGIPSIAIHSVTQETLKVLHSINDRMESVRLDDYYDTYKLTAAYLSLLDSVLLKTD